MVRVEPFFAITFLTPLVSDNELDEGLEVVTAGLASVSSQVAMH